MTLQKAIATFGRDAKLRLSNPGDSGVPEDQLRATLEALHRQSRGTNGIVTG
ncbi:MAG: hypothetical protein OXG70_00655 [Cyanobacteria bacterium MAG IRC1_bin_28]|nr:hypothetical protein [Cyanobacteria bacterium MAG IRC1_bin_28]